MATTSPFFNMALCTCEIEAEPIGSAKTFLNFFPKAHPTLPRFAFLSFQKE